MRLKRPIQTRFRYGYPPPVNLATHHNSQAHSSKGTPSRTTPPQKRSAEDALTACRHTVSGTISRPLTGALFTFPSRYWSAIGHQEVFSLTTWSWQIHTGFHGPRATREHTQKPLGFRLPDSHRLRSAFPCRSTIRAVDNFSTQRQLDQDGPTTPHTQHLPAITRARFRLLRFRSPLLTESLLFSLPAGTEMFHFPAFPPTALYIQTAATPHDGCQVSPFGNPRIKVWLPTPRGISQAPTSFIGS
jgi:hypothetical protein